MPGISFHHPIVNDLIIDTGIDTIDWSYNLVTANFPTYQGEVVQILSVNIGDLTMAGTVSNYAKVEEIYRYFSHYMEQATQGIQGVAYNQEPVMFNYPERGWYMPLMIKTAPGFRISRDVVAPQWRLTAHVVDHGKDLASLSKLVVDHIIHNKDQDFTLTGNIGFNANNPYSDVDASSGLTKTGTGFDRTTGTNISDEIAKGYNKFIPAYLSGDFTALTADAGSTPSFGVYGPGGSLQTHGNAIVDHGIAAATGQPTQLSVATTNKKPGK